MTCRFLIFIFILAICPGVRPVAAVETTTEPVHRFFRWDQGVARDPQPLPGNFDEGAELVWRVELPAGNSTPCVCGDSIYLTTYQAEPLELATVALERQTGKVRWRHVVPVETLEKFHPAGSPASCSPACDGRRVFAFFGSYGLLCYDLQGQLLWTKRMGPFQDEFGAASSPVLVDDLVIINQDHDVNSFIMAIRADSGETAWETSRAEFVRSYSTPLIIDVDGRKQIVVAGSLQLTGYDAASGERLWWVNGLSRIVDSTPCFADGRVYVATWTPGGDESDRIKMEPYADALLTYDANGDGKVGEDELPAGEIQTRFFRMDLNQDKLLDAAEWAKYSRVFDLAQNAAMSVNPRGTGDLTAGIEWTYRRSLPTVPSSVVYQGALYMVKDSGIVTSLDATTGEPIQQGRAAGPGNYYASLVAGDGKVYLCSERGVVTVLAVADRSWEILASHDFGERIMATPVIDQGEFFLRTDAALRCYRKR